MTYHAHTLPSGRIARLIARIVCRRAPDEVIRDEGRIVRVKSAALWPSSVLEEGLHIRVPPPGGIYMNRWVLWSSGGSRKDRMSDKARRGARLLLHEVLRADADPRPHNHPWRWAVALVISGGYCEVRMTDFRGVRLARTWRWPWRPYLMTGTSFHRIDTLKERASWSLFLHGPRRHGWGFVEAVPDDRSGSADWGARFSPFVAD